VSGTITLCYDSHACCDFDAVWIVACVAWAVLVV